MSDSDFTTDSEAEDNEKKDPNYVDWRNMENIRVICRFRPINSREMREEKSAGLVDRPPDIVNNGQCVKVVSDVYPNKAPMEFYLDRILPTDTTQQCLYLNVGKPMVEACLEGYNTTIFAYGQTGSGKTYTMFGPEKLKNNNELGCVQRALSFLFAELNRRTEEKQVTEWKVLLHFVQLYREKLMDLLEPDKGIPLKIRYDPQTDAPYVPNLKQVDVTELVEVIKLLSVANRNRVVDKTLMNAESSRSHMIMTLSIEQTMKDGTFKKSKLNFADLAGSETYEKALGGTRGSIDRKKVEELKTINLSLTNLTTCINYLSKGRKASYRSSQLTFYLMDSLGGNSKTTLVVAASPHIFNRSETIRTLRFAKTAKSVKNNAKVNKELSKAQLTALVKKLQRENKKLKAKLALFEAELIKNGIDLPIESDTKSKKRHKRSKSMKTLMSAETKKSIFGTANLNTSTTVLLQEMEIIDNNTSKKPDKKSLPVVNENNEMPPPSKSTPSKKQAVKDRIFGKVDEAAYNKLKTQLKSLQDELTQNENDSNLLTEQLKKKNIELDELTEELQASREIAQQFDALQESKKQIALQLQSKQEEILDIQQKMDIEREQFNVEKNELEEELNETKDDLQQYEAVMDNMKLNNEQLKQECESLRETINLLQQKDAKQEKENKEKLDKANEILSKYFTVANTKQQLNDKQLDDTETKIETLSQKIVDVTKAYETFTGHNNFSLTAEAAVEQNTDDKKVEVDDDQKEDDKSKDDDKSNDDTNTKPKSKAAPKRKKSPKTSTALQDRMALFGGSAATTTKIRKRRKSKPKNKVKEYTDSIVKTDTKKNLVFQTERLTHYLNSAMSTIDKQKKAHSQELEHKLNAKNKTITNLEIENKALKTKLDEELKDKNDEIEDLRKQIEDLKVLHQSSMLTANMLNDEDEEEDLFRFDDQLAYLSNIGKGYDMDQQQVTSPTLTQQSQRSAHNPTQIAFWRQQLQIGGKLDCLDEGCLWWTSTVTDSDGYRIKVRYDGFDARWDEWIDRGSTRIAPYMTKAKGGRESKGVSVNLKVVAKKKDKRTGKTRRIYKQGWLVKQGGRFKTFKTRYFVLMDDGTMDYFKKMTDVSPLGTFNIKDMVETRRIAYPNKKDLYGFEIVTKDRVWRFQAHSDEIVADWIGIIHAVSKGVEPDDEQQHVIYSGFLNGNNANNTLEMSNGNGFHPEMRRNTTQSATMSQTLQHIPVRSNGHLSIQEESSSHPPINRAAFSQLIDPNGAGNDSDDSPNTDALHVKVPSLTKSQGNESLPLSPMVKTPDEKEIEQIMNDTNIQHSGWMYKAGKWDANWTERFCTLTEKPVTLRCYMAPNKKQTHLINFKNVKSCSEIKKNSEKFNQLEIPTAFAFQLVTEARIYTFACKSRHDANVWLKKIRKVVDASSSSTNTAKFHRKRSSFIAFGSALNKFGTSFGRLIGVTPEHVQTTEVLKTKNVQIQSTKSPSTVSHTKTPSSYDWANINNMNPSNMDEITENRRASLPILTQTQKQNLNGKRRKSAPTFSAMKRRANYPKSPLVTVNSGKDMDAELVKSQFAQEIGTRHRGSVVDAATIQRKQEAAWQRERHTISGRPYGNNGRNGRKKRRSKVDENIAAVLRSSAANTINDEDNVRDDNILHDESEENLSDIE